MIHKRKIPKDPPPQSFVLYILGFNHFREFLNGFTIIFTQIMDENVKITLFDFKTTIEHKRK